uniref:Serine protease family S54 putative n=1 Tax=Albugo laibachii Nc14 TaxID=890382 RepID=F0VZ63_9STRA|nr:serine protease family S54 putative [Albugo laibachii Nc14]|eukprot:CCA14078.1 serine protease family S54 putative [Albugo laibachii Nc14]
MYPAPLLRGRMPVNIVSSCHVQHSIFVASPRFNTRLWTHSLNGLCKRGLNLGNQTSRPRLDAHYAHLSRARWFNSKSGRRMNITSDGVIHALILSNVMVTFMWASAITRQRKVRMLTHFTTSYEHLQSGRYYTLLTCVFSHAQVSHLFANMVGLYFFGRQVAQILGPKRFLYLYLSSGVVSSYAAVWEQRKSKKTILNLGASGAVNAITALSVLTFPHSMVYIFGILPMPAWLFGVVFIGKDFYGWFQEDTHIGHFAHLGGAMCGAVYHQYWKRSMPMRWR